MGDETKDGQIVILLERVTNLVDAMDEIRTELKAQSGVVQRIPLLEQSLQSNAQSVGRAFKTIEAVNVVVNKHSEALTANRTTSRIIGTIASGSILVAVGFTGWAWGQLDGLHNTDNQLNIRITTLEVQAKAASDMANRFENQQGYRRDRNQ